MSYFDELMKGMTKYDEKKPREACETQGEMDGWDIAAKEAARMEVQGATGKNIEPDNVYEYLDEWEDENLSQRDHLPTWW